MSSTQIGSFFIIVSAGFWGGATVLSKSLLIEVPVASLVLLQLCGSVLFLWFACLCEGSIWTLSYKAIPGALLGVLEPGLAYLIGTLGLARTSASEASLLFALEPAFVFLFASILCAFRPRSSDLALLVLAVVGVGLVGAGDWDIISSERLLGNSLVVLGTSFAALYVVLSRRALEHSSVLATAALQHTVALLLIACAWPFMCKSGEAKQLFSISWVTLFLVLGIGIVQYSLAFVCYLKAIERLHVCTAAMFLNLIPVFGIAAGTFLLGERLVTLQWIGASVLLVALLGFTRRKFQFA